jgi:hypothetical protein
MGIFDMFKKKKEPEAEPFGEEDIFKEPTAETPSPMTEPRREAFPTGVPEAQVPEPKVTFGKPEEPGMEAMKPRLEPAKLEPAVGVGRETELILSKLEAIKANLDNINLRLENLERAAKEKKLW